MEITEVKVFPVRDKKLRAFASIVLDGSFMVNDIKVIQGKDGLFISMPSRRQKNGRFKDIAHPLNQGTRQVLEEQILAEFRRVAEGGEDQPEPETRAAPQSRAEPRRAASGQSPAAPQRPVASASRPDPRGPAAPRGRAEPARPAAAPVAAAEDPAAAEKTAAVEEAAVEESKEASSSADGKSLEEVAEAHLSDSYWTT